MNEIFCIVDETPFIANLQKQFYKTMLQTRKECILDFFHGEAAEAGKETAVKRAARTYSIVLRKDTLL